MQKSFWLALGSCVVAFPAAAQEAAEPAAGPLTVEGGLVIWTLVVFALLLVFIGKMGWPKLLQAVRDREAELERRLAEAARAREEAAQLLEEHKRLLAGAHGQAQGLINEAKVGAQKEREALLQKARDEHDQMLQRAKREIEMERERAIVSLRREAVDLSLAVASKLLEERLDNEANRRLVTQYLGSVENTH